MKTRNGFVSNSSSSSFIIISGIDLANKDNFFNFNNDSLLYSFPDCYNMTKEELNIELERLHKIISSSKVTLSKNELKKYIYNNFNIDDIFYLMIRKYFGCLHNTEHIDMLSEMYFKCKLIYMKNFKKIDKFYYSNEYIYNINKINTSNSSDEQKALLIKKSSLHIKKLYDAITKKEQQLYNKFINCVYDDFKNIPYVYTFCLYDNGNYEFFSKFTNIKWFEYHKNYSNNICFDLDEYCKCFRAFVANNG